MRLRFARAPLWLGGIAAVVVAAAVAFLLWLRYAPRRITVTAGKFPEELVYVRSTDDIVNGGVMFTVSKTSAKPIAVLWIHGWGTNFYSPTYAMIGRALAARNYTTISGNTRMHDLGNVRLMAAGEGDALIRDPKRSFPSYISAATFLDIANSPPESKDFFGVQTQTLSPGVTLIRCPLLAFFGTRGDVGNEEDLELLKSAIQRQRSGPSRVDTVMIRNADHMYTGEEAQVAETIAEWANTLPLPPSSGRSGVSEKR